MVGVPTVVGASSTPRSASATPLPVKLTPGVPPAVFGPEEKLPPNDSWFEKKLFWLNICSTPMNPKLMVFFPIVLMKSAFTVPMGPWLVTPFEFPVVGPSREIANPPPAKLTVGNIGSTWLTYDGSPRVVEGLKPTD